MNRYQRIAVNGIHYNLDRQEAIDCGINAGGWEMPVLDAVRRYLKPGMTALDIGANVGAHALPMAQMVGSEGIVYAFEPMEWAYEKLWTNCQLNPGLPIVPCHFGFGEREAEFLANFRSSWLMAGGRQDRPSSVIIKRLDGWWQSANDLKWWTDDQRVDVIKMDVDGNEFGVLLGGTQLLLHMHPVIITEAVTNHFSNRYTDPFLLLQEFQYRFTDLVGNPLTHAELKASLPLFDPEMTTSINIIAVPR